MPRLFLSIARLFGIVLIEPIAIIPRGSMWLPRPETHPTELGSARLILAYHVVAAAVLLDGDVALGTLFGVGRDPVGRLRVVVALLYPLLEPLALDRVVPQLAAPEAEHVAAEAPHSLRVKVLRAHCIRAVGRRAPPHQAVALDEAVCD